MTQPTQTVQPHPASVDAYISRGWALVPIPPGSKGPSTPGWNRSENRLRSQTDVPAGYGIGLAHAYSRTMALDIDNWDEAAALLALVGVDLTALYDAPDAVIIDSGRQGRGKLLYEMPFGSVLPSKKVNAGSKAIYELRCGTTNGLTVQDVLPPSIHPLTNAPYRWAGRGHWSRLPPIPDALLTHWNTLLAADSTRSLPALDSVAASWSEVRSAVEVIPANTNRDEWLRVGMALHWAGSLLNEAETGFYIWDEWSRTAPEKYPGEQTMFGQWRSFKSDKADKVTFGTLFHMAKFYGWKRPPVDASSLFTKVESNPQQVIESLRPQPPDLDISLFPEVLRVRALEISESVGCDPIVPLFAGLAAVVAAADAQSRLTLVDGFEVPPILWLMTIGEPADKKSPGSRPMLAPLARIEVEDRARYKRALLDWESVEAMYAASKTAFVEHSKSADALLSLPPEVIDLPPQPVPLRLTVSDVTSQKLVRQVAERPKGVLCYLDEMNSWVRKITDKMGGEDRSTWVVSYEAQPYSMDRVGAGSIHAENMAVGIYGNIQPRVFRENIDQLSADGLIQRFIPAVLRGAQTRLGNPIPDFMNHDAQWENTLRLIHALPITDYTLEPAAYEQFRAFQHWYEAAKVDERILNSDPIFMTAFGKIEGTLGRLVFLMHLLENPFSTIVSAGIVERVIRLVKTFIIPSFRFAFGEVAGRDSFDIWMVEHVVAHADEGTISLADIRRAARKWLDGMSPWSADQTVIGSMSMLEKLDWVKRTDDGKQEVRHTAAWFINPALVTMFADYRDQIEQARERSRGRLAAG